MLQTPCQIDGIDYSWEVSGQGEFSELKLQGEPDLKQPEY